MMLAIGSVSITNINDGIKGDQGDQGIGISSEKEQWYLSTSNTSLKGGSWSYTEPSSVPDGYYLWGRLEFTMTNGNKTYSDAVYRSIIGGVINKTDELDKIITQKVWQSDITTAINSYDNTTGTAIRDRVTQTETDIDGIHTSVSDLSSAVGYGGDSHLIVS